MKKLILAGIALLILVIGVAMAVPVVTEGPGISFYVTGLNDGMNIQVDADGYLYSNGDGTYAASCPFTMPVELRNGKLKLSLYSGTGQWNQLIVKTGGSEYSWTKQDYYFDIRKDFPVGDYVFTAQGKTDYQKMNVKFELTGRKYGPRDFYIDANGIQGSGMAKVRILIGGVKKFEKTYYFGDQGDKTPEVPKVVPLPTRVITPRPTPTPQPTKSPGQIWAERNCWWYRA